MDLRRWMLASFMWLTPGGAEACLDFFAQFSMSTFCGAGAAALFALGRGARLRT